MRNGAFLTVFVALSSALFATNDAQPKWLQDYLYLSASGVEEGNEISDVDFSLESPEHSQEGAPPPPPETAHPDHADEPPHIYSLSKEQPKGPLYKKPDCPPSKEGYTVNFENISVIQLIQFISKISGVNFIFDDNDLQFNITIVSQDPTSVEDLTAALVQILKIHGLSAVEQGNNLLIYRNNQLSKVSTVITDKNINDACNAAVITRVFRLHNVGPSQVATIIKPLVSPDAVVEVSMETRHLIVSDLTANVDKVADLLNALDTPNAAFDVAEYYVKSAYPTALVAYAKEILQPLAYATSAVAYAKEILQPLTVDNPLQMIAQPSSGKIFIVSTPYLIQKALLVLESLDTSDIAEVVDLPSDSIVNNRFHMYKLRYQNGREIAAALREIGVNLQYAGVSNVDFVNTIYSAQWLEVNNSIVITGTQAAIDKVLSLVEDLDKAPKQVYIEVLIIDTTLKNSLDFGVQWVALGDEQNKVAYASGLLSNAPPSPNIQGNIPGTSPPGGRFVAANPASNPPLIPNPGRDVPLPTPSNLTGFSDLADTTSAFGFGVVGNIIRHNGQSFLTLGALVSALEEEAQTTVVLNPRIMTEDTQPATIFVGQNIPYQTTSTVIQQTGSVTQNIQYEDIGVQLDVTPTISPQNVVTLEINQSIAELISAVGTLTPTTSKTLATTRLHVPDGTFLVMSGHVRDKESCIHSGIPCLGSLPLIGPTFSRNIDQREKRNLIMFIRPHVVTNLQEGVELTNEQGYQHNWNSHPCSMIEFGPEEAPECETYPPCP